MEAEKKLEEALVMIAALEIEQQHSLFIKEVPRTLQLLLIMDYLLDLHALYYLLEPKIMSYFFLS